MAPPTGGSQITGHYKVLKLIIYLQSETYQPQWCYRETLEYYRFSFIAFVSVSSDLARGIFCSTISSQTEHDICTSDAHCFRIGSLRRSREKLPNRRIRCHSLFNAAMCPWLVRTVRRDWQHSLRNAQRKNCRHKLYKTRNLLLLLLCRAALSHTAA